MKLFATVCSFLVLLSCAVNIYVKTTYVDLIHYGGDMSGVDDYTITFNIDQCSTDMIDAALNKYSQADVVALVQPTGEMRQEFDKTLVEVSIINVYQGDQSIIGQTVTYISNFYFNCEVKICVSGFINHMMPDNQYLVALSNWVEPQGWKDDGHTYYYNRPGSAFAYLNINEVENILPVYSMDENGFPKYGELKNNEVFASTQEGIDSFKRLKAKVFETYGVLTE